MKYNSIGEQLIAKAQELDPNYKPDKFNDMSEAIDILLNNSGGDIWLDIAPYLNEDMTSISQEGYDLVYNAFFPDVENPINKYVGISIMKTKLIFNEFILSDTSNKEGFSFIYNATIDGVKGCMKLFIYNDKSINIIEGSDSSNKIWYENITINDDILLEEQYNDLVTYAKQGLLAGIKIDHIFIPLEFISDTNVDKPTLYFQGWFMNVGIANITINGENRKVVMDTQNVLTSYNKKEIANTVFNTAVTTDDTEQRIDVDFLFPVAQDLHTFINRCINDYQTFTANLYLKTPTVNGTTLRIMTPLTLMNVHNGDDVYFSFRFYLTKNDAFDCLVGVSANKIALSFFIEDATEYTTYKSLASSLFTKQTQVKLEVIQNV